MRRFGGSLKSSPTAMLLLSGGGWSLCVQIVSKSSIIISLAASARILNVEDLGLFVSMQAIGLLATAIWDAGFSPMLMRDVAAHESDFSEDLRSALLARAILLPLPILAFVAGCIAISVSGRQAVVAAAIVGSGALVGGVYSLFQSGIQAQLRFRTAALTTSMGRVLVAVISVAVAWYRPPMPLVALAVAYLAGELFILFAQYGSVKSTLMPTGRRPRVSQALRRQGQALPYALNSLFVMVYNRMDIVLVTWFAGTYQAGIFAPASRLQDALIFLPATASAALVPIASGRFSRTGDSSRLFRTATIVAVLSFTLTMPMLVIVFLAAESVIPGLLGQEYLLSVDAIRIIVWSLVFIALAHPFFSIVVAAGRALELNLAYGSAFVVALVGHAVFDPWFGAVGAAWVAVMRDAVGALVGIAVAVLRIKMSGRPLETTGMIRQPP
jgi:O-antigen/teichoic acid export membrane protein